MRRRRNLSDLSQKLIGYFTSRVSMSQSEIAELLEVDKSFISRVNSGERELSHFHMERLASKLGVDVGVMMIDASRSTKKLSPESARIAELCEKLILKCEAVKRGLVAGDATKRASEN